MRLSPVFCGRILAAAILLFTGITANAQSPKATSFNTSTPSRFTENKGQVTDQNGSPRPDVKYIYSAPGMKVIFKENSFSYEMYTVEKQEKISEATGKPEEDMMPDKFKEPDPVTVRTHRVDITLPGSARRPQIIAEGKSTDYTNYYLAHTSEEGVQNVFGYSKLTYKNIWPKVDLVLYARKEGELKYDIVLHPGAKLSDVKFAYAGMKGLKLDGGKLKIRTALGEAEESVPLSYLKGSRVAVDAAMRVKGSIVGYSAAWDGDQTLVIDPVLKWGTYYGGNKDERGNAIVSDNTGCFVMTGTTNSTSNIATSGVHNSSNSGFDDAFVVKFSSSGSRKWGTYFGGTQNDLGIGIASDTSNNILVTGQTASTGGIATSGAHNSSKAGLYDGFIVKLSSSGSRIWGTYFGGSNDDYGYGIAVDKAGNTFVTGQTFGGGGLYTPGAHQESTFGIWDHGDAFISKFDSSGSMRWSTYYGGTSIDAGFAITVDDSGNVLATGSTSSYTNISTPGAHITTNSGPTAFLVKFNGSGSRLWGTYYGSSSAKGYGIVSDDSCNVYVTGSTYSSYNVATPGVHKIKKLDYNDCDAFVIKFNTNGTRQWGTLFGGDNWGSIAWDMGYGIATGDSGTVLIGGKTYSDNGIASPGAYQTQFGGFVDAFIAKFKDGKRVWSTYYGGTDRDEGYGIATDNKGNAVMVGFTTSKTKGIATAGAHQTSFGGSEYDAFTVKFYDGRTNDLALVALPGLSADVCAGESLPIRIALENMTSKPDSNVRIKVIIQGQDTLSLTDSLMKTINGNKRDTLEFFKKLHLTVSGTYKIIAFRIPNDYNPDNDTLSQTIVVHPRPSLSFVSGTGFCEGEEILINNTSADSTIPCLWKFGDGTTSTVRSPSKSYATAGTYTIWLYASTDKGCTDSVFQQVTIYSRANVSFSASDACTGIDIGLNNTSTISGDTIKSWLWNFGDGTSSAAQSPSKSYDTAGKYTIWLYATSANGCTDSASQEITIFPRSQPAFSASDVCLGDTVHFTNGTGISSGSVSKYLWLFGDGDTSTIENPVHVYSGSGSYNVILFSSSNNGCIDSVQKTVTVYSLPDAAFSSTQKNGYNVQLMPVDTTYSSYLWDFGGGKTSTDKKPIHDFQQAGSYAVTLKVTSAEGCISEVTDTVVVQISSVSDHSLPQYSVTVYPNPFDNNLNIRYTLPQPSHVSLELLDITCRSIIRVDRGYQPVGEQKITLSADKDLQPGVYLLRLNAGGRTTMQKVVKSASGY